MGEVKRDIMGFTASLKGLRRDAVQLSRGNGVVPKAFSGTLSLSCKINYVHP